MQKEEQLFRKRVQELANCAYQRNIVTFTDFLTPHELQMFHEEQHSMTNVRFETYGGYASSERQMGACIPNDLSYEFHYPIEIIKIEALHKKFAEPLSHRDYLGSILNSGIDRSRLGDILCCDSCAYVFCTNTISEFLCTEITRIRHTSVQLTIVNQAELPEPKYEEITGSVASERLDCMMALAFHASRNSLDKLAQAEKVMINGKPILSNSRMLQEGDIVSVRGYGKFRYAEKINVSKKNRLFVKLEKYV